MRLYIFRHGKTYFSVNNLPYGDQVENAEILPESIPTIKNLAVYLRDILTEANITSPYKRCLQTSSIVSDITGKKFDIDVNLRDWDPRNETKEDLIKRIIVFGRHIMTNDYKSVLVCTHGYPINALIAFFTKGEIKESDLDNFPDPGVLVTIDGGKVSYKDFN
jgi:broad specificity phosphatase PhoE